MYGYLPGALRPPSLLASVGTVACRCAHSGIRHQLCWVEDPEGRDRSAPIVPRRRVASPVHETPFSLSNPYTGQPTFDELFRSAFIQTYVRAGSATARLDVWRCRGSPSASKVPHVVSKNGLSRRAESICRAVGNDGGKGACGLWKTTCPPQSRYQNLYSTWARYSIFATPGRPFSHRSMSIPLPGTMP